MINILIQGGLGNQMFQYAAGSILAKHYGTKLCIDLSFVNSYRSRSWARPYALDTFDIDSRIRNYSLKQLLYLQSREKLFGRNVYKNLPERGLFSIPDGSTLYGYFMEPSIADLYPSSLDSLFHFKSPLKAEDKVIADRIRAKESVSVHLRRGDYLLPSNARIFPTIDLQWYMKAIDLIREKIPGAEFYFFSDDPAYTLENFAGIKGGHFETCTTKSTAARDMHLMALCQNHIITNSTFSWWAARLYDSVEKIVIFPEHSYFNPLNNERFRGICPKHWLWK